MTRGKPQYRRKSPQGSREEKKSQLPRRFRHRQVPVNVSTERQWIKIITRFPKVRAQNLYMLTWKGVPKELRGLVWRMLAETRMFMSSYPKGYYNELADRSDGTKPCHQIRLDVPRTFNDHPHFSSKDGKGQDDLYRVLKAYSYHNEEIGYCQGMSYIVGVLLLHMEAEEAFFTLISILERRLKNFFDVKLSGLQRQIDLFSKILSLEQPKVVEHLVAHGIVGEMYVTPWFMSLFTTHLENWETVLRIWDVFFLEGSDAIQKVGLALHRALEKRLLSVSGVDKILPLLQHVPSEFIEPNTLLLLASNQVLPYNAANHAIAMEKAEKENSVGMEKRYPLDGDERGRSTKNSCAQSNSKEKKGGFVLGNTLMPWFGSMFRPASQAQVQSSSRTHEQSPAKSVVTVPNKAADGIFQSESDIDSLREFTTPRTSRSERKKEKLREESDLDGVEMSEFIQVRTKAQRKLDHVSLNSPYVSVRRGSPRKRARRMEERQSCAIKRPREGIEKTPYFTPLMTPSMVIRSDTESSLSSAISDLSDLSGLSTNTHNVSFSNMSNNNSLLFSPQSFNAALGADSPTISQKKGTAAIGRSVLADTPAFSPSSKHFEALKAREDIAWG